METAAVPIDVVPLDVVLPCLNEATAGLQIVTTPVRGGRVQAGRYRRSGA